MTSFANRILLSAKLNPEVYEEVEADRTAMGQAVAVVIISSIAAGIGTIQQTGLGGLLLGTLLALTGWIVWAGLTYYIGTRFLPEPETRADYGELLRTIGFASSPGIIRVLGIIPGLASIVFLVAAVWMLVAMVIAVRQALDYRSTWRALGVCLIGWVIQALITMLVFACVGGPAHQAQAG
jgi:hypothetical protein